MENLQVTSQGLAAALSAGEMGLRLKLTRFRLGSGTGYTPASDGSDTDLQGPVVHTDAISGYVLEANGQLKLVLRLSAAAGTFTFGELAIDAEVTPGVFLMFASAVLPSPLTKESSLSSSAPSTFTFNCYIKLEQGNSIIQVVPGDVNAGGADYSAQIYNLQQQINNIGTPSNFQPQIDALTVITNNLTTNLNDKPDLATYAELSSPTPPQDKAVAANHLLNKAGDNVIQLTPGGLYLPQSALGGGGGGGGGSQPSVTLPAILTNATNQVVASGIVAALGLDLGDVVQVELSGQGNNKLFTVTTITDASTIKFNEGHTGYLKTGARGSKSLNNESATLKFTRITKWYNAPIGLGQSWHQAVNSIIIPSPSTPSYTLGAKIGRTANHNRAIMLRLRVPEQQSSFGPVGVPAGQPGSAFYVDGVAWASTATTLRTGQPRTHIPGISDDAIVPVGGSYLYSSSLNYAIVNDPNTAATLGMANYVQELA